MSSESGANGSPKSQFGLGSLNDALAGVDQQSSAAGGEGNVAQQQQQGGKALACTGTGEAWRSERRASRTAKQKRQRKRRGASSGKHNTHKARSSQDDEDEESSSGSAVDDEVGNPNAYYYCISTPYSRKCPEVQGFTLISECCDRRRRSG